MGISKNKRTVFLTKAIEELDELTCRPADKRAKREEKRLLKKARKKHERGVGKRELKNKLEG
jgi:hypothetical protein